MGILHPRDVPLGGLRAMTVWRTLPHRERVSVGPWVFLDHYGPANTAMDVAPHPHTGLATVSWLFDGEITHHDSAGYHQKVLPGSLVMMAAGRGICHSEESTSAWLHGVQLWLAYPEKERGGAQNVQVFTPTPQRLGAGNILLFMGQLPGLVGSPVVAPRAALGAELSIPAGRSVTVPVPTGLEIAVLNDADAVTVAGENLTRGALWYTDAEGHDTAVVIAAPATNDVRVMLLGGQPLGEEFVLWWNFIGSTHEEVAAMRQQWEDPSTRVARYGRVVGYAGAALRIPAPPLPEVRLKPRGNRQAHHHAPGDPFA